MSDLSLKAEIDGHQRVDDALREGLKEGLKETGEWLQRRGKRRAQERVRATDRVWRERVYHGFSDPDGTTEGGTWEGSLRNEAPHAEIVEDGLEPGEANPPVQNIIEWVSDKLTPEPATGRDLSDWDPELQALAEDYHPGYVLTAFAVKEHIEKEGYRGIGYMDAAERYMSSIGPMVLHRKVEKNMERALRRHGLK